MAMSATSTLLAHKAINLASELSNSEKLVAGAIVDHFNRKTGQCDPSLHRIADLIGLSRRTVIRAIKRLEKLGFIRRTRHGGHFHRNSYAPVWSRFLQIESEWNARRSRGRSNSAASKVSPFPGQMSHLGGDSAAPQTFLNDPTKVTLAERAPKSVLQQPARSDLNGSAEQVQYRAIFASEQKAPAARSSTAARDAAERRWNNELLDRYRGKPFYERIVEAIDEKLSSDTTEAELRLRGSGLAYLVHELAVRDATIFEIRGTLS